MLTRIHSVVRTHMRNICHANLVTYMYIAYLLTIIANIG